MARDLMRFYQTDGLRKFMKPIALDLFCRAGGAAMGLHQAGFDVVGVDIDPQPDYPFKFVQADAMEYPLNGFDLIWASPPCQAYTNMQRINTRSPKRNSHPKLIAPLRDRLYDLTTTLWVIENVPGAPLKNPVTLCGSTFDLKVRRHRLFEASFTIPPLPCCHKNQGRSIAVYGDHPQEDFNRHKPGHVNRARTLKEGQDAMGIDWMKWSDLTQAIPPAYSKYIGHVALAHLKQRSLEAAE